MKLSRLKPSLLTMAVTLAAAIMFSEFFMARRNVLAFKKGWRIAQEGFINPGLNAVPSLIYRRLLTGYRLRSDHLMGVQRLFSREEILPEKLEAWFRIGDEGYVDLITGGTEESYVGIRLSSTAVFPSMIYEANHEGKYLRTSPLKVEVEPGFVHAVVEKGKLSLGKKTWGLPSGLFRKGMSGVQVSFKDVELYAFSARGNGREQYLHFFPDGNRLGLYAQTFLILLALVALTGLLPRVRKENTALILLGTGTLLLAFQFVYVPRDEQIDSNMTEFRVLDAYWKPAGEEVLSVKIEALHTNKFFPGSNFCHAGGCELLPEGKLPPPKKSKRILFFGGSQIQPSLVTDIRKSFFFRFESQLRKRYPDIEILNLYSQGLFRERLAKYGHLLPRIHFDEVIIETLSFDHEVTGIIDFIREWSARGVKVIFLRRAINPILLEEKTAFHFMEEIRKGFASSLGNEGWHIPEVIRIMPEYRKAQKEIGYIFLDPNSLLMREEVLRSGELFWDGFHLTAWGQELASDWLASEYLSQDQSSK